MNLRHWGLAACVAAATIAPAWGQTASSDRHRQITVVKMTIHPAAEPDPALQYTLLPTVMDQQPGNAVPIYKELIAAWEKRDDRHELAKKVADWGDDPLDELPDDDVTRALAAFPLDRLHDAARYERCDWQLPLRTAGITMNLPPLGIFRTFARALALDARRHIAAGDYAEALRSMQTGFAIARHMGETPTLINALVETAIASLMLDVVIDWQQRPDSPNLYWALASLPRPFVDMRQSLEWERSYIYSHAPSMREVARADLSDEKWRHVKIKLIAELTELVQVVGDIGEWRVGAPQVAVPAICLKYYTPAKQYLLAHGYDADRVEEMDVIRAVVLYLFADYEHWYGESLKWLALPYPIAHAGIRESDAAFRAAKQAGAMGPLTPSLMPSLSKAYFLVVRLDRKIAALGGIEAVRMQTAGQWPTSLADTVLPAPANPVTGKPFGFCVEGTDAVLNADALEGHRPSDSTRYEIILTD